MVEKKSLGSILILAISVYLWSLPSVLAAEEAPRGHLPRIVENIPLHASTSVRDWQIVPSMKFNNKLIVGTDKRLAFRLLKHEPVGVSMRASEAKLKLKSGYVVTTVELVTSAPGTFSIWDNEVRNEVVRIAVSPGDPVTLSTNWLITSRCIKFSWKPKIWDDDGQRGLIINSIGLAHVKDFDPAPDPSPTATVAASATPSATPTAVQATAIPTSTSSATRTATPTKSSTQTPTPTATRTSTRTPVSTATSAPTSPTSPTPVNDGDECPGFDIQGFGRGTTGGCGGTVYRVTRLDDAITPLPGMFRYYVQNVTGKRIIKFAVSGTIKLVKDVKLLNGDVTIDAGDAPGGGVQFSGATLVIGASNVILRHLRHLVGPYGPTPSSADNIRIVGDRGFWVEHVVLDHCSMQWAVDENFSIVEKVRFVTVQWSIIAEGLYRSTHDKQADPHSMGTLITHDATHMTFHHNLFAHNNYRNPQLASRGLLEWTNNVVYNSGSAAGILQTPALADENWVDAVGNFNKMGPNSDWAGSKNRHSWRLGVVLGASHIFVKGNLDWNRVNHSQAEKAVVAPALWPFISGTRFVPAPMPATSAEKAYEDVLKNAGATLPCRSSVDRRILQETDLGTGGFIDFPEERGGWPNLTAGCQ